ncbi:predicted GPI-anchored protein 58 [Phragmites australis]|uniref:predicted GPI-anchored protein 58 n=1 Tax=Phragmites australis TaxID=29695 RepID=UPI002D782479|nr:predicted GPI-anchored protein 58 [Phragmites australis]
MVPEGQREASVLMPVSLPPITDWLECVVVLVSFVAAGLLALYADPGRVALQATLLEFDAQGLVDRLGHRNPGTIQIPRVDEETGGAQRTSGRDTAGGRPQTDGRDAADGRTQADGKDATGNRPQAGRGAAAGSSHHASRGVAGSGAAALEDKGKCPRVFVPQPLSSSSPSPPRQQPAVGSTKEPPKDPVGDQRRLEAPRPAPAPEPSVPAPEPSTPAELEPQAPPCPEPRVAAALEQPAPVEPTPSTSRAGQVAAARAAPTWQPSGTLSTSTERARMGPSARPSSSQTPEPLPDVLGSTREVIERLEVAVAAE